MTWDNNFWYTRVASNGGHCSDVDLNSKCDDEIDSDV
jgi:hypothetical protein